jgi:hypothetical protein
MNERQKLRAEARDYVRNMRERKSSIKKEWETKSPIKIEIKESE